MAFNKKLVVIRSIVNAILTIMTGVSADESDYPPPSHHVTKIPEQLAVLRCQVADIVPRNVGWHRNGTPVSELGSRFVTKKDTGDLIVFVMQVEDEGNFTCYATRGAKFKPYTVSLTVCLLPEVRVDSANPVAPMEGGVMTMVCSAYGKPRPRFDWFTSQERRLVTAGNASGEPMDRMAIEDRYLGQLTVESSLHVSPVVWQDRGQFKCIATNSLGSARREVSVDVQFTPKMLTRNEKQEIHWWKGHKINITCVATGNPSPTIVWEPSEVITPVISKSQRTVVSSTLWFPKDSQVEFPVEFTCHAQNKLGSTGSRQFFISQVYAPPPPQLTVLSIGDDEVTMAVQVPYQEATPTPTYVSVDYMRVNSTRWMTSGTYFERNGTKVTLRGIILGQSYLVQVRVYNKVGYSNQTVLTLTAEQYSIFDATTTTALPVLPTLHTDSKAMGATNDSLPNRKWSDNQSVATIAGSVRGTNAGTSATFGGLFPSLSGVIHSVALVWTVLCTVTCIRLWEVVEEMF